MRLPHRTPLLVLALLLLAARPASAAYPIGHVSVHFYDPSRSNRDVGVEIYYPATAAGNGTPVATPPADGFPIVTFGHGYQMIVQAYQNIWEALVPAGFVVALPITEGGLFPSHANFGADLAFVVQRLRTENLTPASIFYARLGAKAAVIGHSMGGGASFLAAEADPSIDALAALAPANTNPSAITAAGGIQAPTLVISGSADCVAPAAQHQVPMYGASVSTCKSYVSVTGASHCQFGVNNTLCNLGEIFCGSPGISRATQHALVNSLLLPWLAGVLQTDWQSWANFETTLTAASGFTAQQSCPVSPAPPPACANGVDDDGDGLIDHPGDDGCNAASDPTEQKDCSNGIDDDGDGLVDAADPGCNLVQLGRENPQCSNGVDDDTDGAIDTADSLCQGAWDDDEASNPPPLACGLLGTEALLAAVLARRLRPLFRRGSR